MIRGALLLGVMWFVADLSQSDRWLLRLCYVIGVAAVNSFLVCFRKHRSADDFWQTPRRGWIGESALFCDVLLPRQPGAF